jgi:hypothetical protein
MATETSKIVFDVRLGRRGGSRYRDRRTGRFAPVPPCPPHWWLVDKDNIGYCRKCGETKDFREGMLKY